MQLDDRQADAGDGADDRRLHPDVMHEVRLQPLIECADFADDADEVPWMRAAAPPVQRMQLEAVAFDGRAAVHDVCGNVHFIAGAQSGAGHRQAVRQEVPVLGHQIDQHWPNGLICTRHYGRSH